MSGCTVDGAGVAVCGLGGGSAPAVGTGGLGARRRVVGGPGRPRGWGASGAARRGRGGSASRRRRARERRRRRGRRGRGNSYRLRPRGRPRAQGGHLDQRQLQLQSGIGPLPDGPQGLAQEVDEGHGARRRDPAGLAAQRVQLLLGQGDAGRHVVGVLDHVEVAQVAEQILHELAVVGRPLAQPLHEEQGPSCVVLVNEIDDLEQQVVLDDAQDVESLLQRDLAAGVGGQLVEDADGVAEAASGRPGDDREGRLGHLDALLRRRPSRGRRPPP